LAVDREGRLYVVANRPDASVEPHLNRVTIFRTTGQKGGLPGAPRTWFETSYPYGIGTFNHGVSKIEVGPDGMVYVSSGSRTDHGEAGSEPHRSREGEVPMTGCIWKLDPASERPQAEIWASGIRNAFGFCWDGAGRMWGTENGPNADAPEELNRIEEGRHYGFPYAFSDVGRVYPDQPAAPEGLKTEMPVMNLGPAGGGSTARPLGTFDPHSSPSGIVWVKDWGGEFRDGFLVARFGNLIGPRDVGFDLLWVKVKGEHGGRVRAEVNVFIEGVGRVTDLIKVGEKVYVCVYDVATKNAGAEAVTGHGGRILEVGRE
jgi:glucose/arabinose dehydrogenase